MKVINEQFQNIISHIFNSCFLSDVFLEGAGLNLYHTNNFLGIFVKSGSDVKEKISFVSLSDLLLPVAPVNTCC